jgi:hypothetical protein
MPPRDAVTYLQFSHNIQQRAEVFMPRRAYPMREEFEIKENEVMHRPTNASWSAYPGKPEPSTYRRSMLGGVLPNGDDYREDEVTAMALSLLASRPIA